MKKYCMGLTVLVLNALIFSHAFADTVKLRNGNTVEGKILEKTDKFVKLEMLGTSLTYYYDEIESINADFDSKTIEASASNSQSIGNTDKSVPQILEQVKKVYSSLQTYKARGSSVMDMKGGMNLTMDFKIMLKKPNLYLISWEQTTPKMGGTVWNDGTQPHLYMGMTNSYSNISSDEMALAAATGISGGVAFTMPSIFLSVFMTPSSILDGLQNPILQGIEKIAKEDCFVISGSSKTSKKERLWIAKSSYLIKQYSRSLESSPGGQKIPEMTDEQLEETLKAMGLKSTPEIIQRMKEDLSRAQNLSSTFKMEGSAIQTYEDISSPQLNKEDFQFQLPEGAVLEESLFETSPVVFDRN